jgi:hypothetical protein
MYAKLGRSPSQVFPVRFESDVEVRGGPLKGTIPGFLFISDVGACDHPVVFQ